MDCRKQPVNFGQRRTSVYWPVPSTPCPFNPPLWLGWNWHPIIDLSLELGPTADSTHVQRRASFSLRRFGAFSPLPNPTFGTRPRGATLSRIHSVGERFTNEETDTNWCRAGPWSSRQKSHRSSLCFPGAHQGAALQSTASLRLSDRVLVPKGRPFLERCSGAVAWASA